MRDRFAVALLVVWAAMLLSCGAAPAAPPSVLLVTLDTTRADRLGSYGHTAARTPNLDVLARAGVVFEAAYAATAITLPSHASILTGVYPTAHGVHSNAEAVLGDAAQTLSEVLLAAGWRTGAFVGSYVLDRRFGLAQGFEVYRGVSSDQLGASATHIDERPAAEVVRDALQWLDGLAADEPFFAWLHFYDPHAPYAAPDPWPSRVADSYDAEIAYVDAQLGSLLRELERRGRTGNLLVAVTADHGESLGEHGEDTHGVFLHEATIRVPLILWGRPVTNYAGTRVDSPVSNASIPATVLRLLGLADDALPHSELAPLLPPAPASTPSDAVYFESHLPYDAFRWRAQRGVRAGPVKLIDGSQEELYRLDQDPAEESDLAATDSPQLGRMRSHLEAVLARHPPLGWASGYRPGVEERDRFEALGYVISSGGAEGSPFDPGLPDPRVHIGDLALMAQASEIVGVARRSSRVAPDASASDREWAASRAATLLGDARLTLRKVTDRNPGHMEAVLRLAEVEMLLGNHEEAVRLVARVAEAWPGNAEVHFNLGVAYSVAGREEEALRAAERAVAIEPAYPSYVDWLVERQLARGQLERATALLEVHLAHLTPGSKRERAVATHLAELREQAGEALAQPEG